MYRASERKVMSAESKKNIVKMAMIYSQEGKWDKAIGEYKKLLTLDPTDFNVHNMLGDAYSKKGKDDLAYQEYIVAAEAYIKQGLADKANIIYKKIGRLDSNKLSDKDRQKQILIKKHTMAEKLIENGEIDKAIETYKEIIKLSPANFDTYQKLGELYFEKGETEEALSYYKKIVDIYFKNRLYKKALPIYQKILEIQPDNISIREKIAEIFEREGNESDAKREYLNLAEHYWKERNIDKTDFYAQKAVEFKSIEAHYLKGAALYAKQEYGEAKKELEMLLKFKANHSGALGIMAGVYKETGQVDEAINTFNKVVKAEPENTEAQEALGELYIQKGNKKDAVAQLLVAVNVYNKKHEYDKASDVLHKILGQEPENVEVLQKLGEICSNQKKKKEAADVYIKISEIYTKEKMEDKAKEYYKMAEEMDPAHPKIVEKAKKLAEKKAPPPPKEPPAPPKAQAPAPAPPKPQEKIEPLPDLMEIKKVADKPGQPPPPPTPKTPPPPAQKPQQPPAASKSFKPLPDIEIVAQGSAVPKKPPEKAPPPPPREDFKVPEQTKDDIPALIAMADSYIKTGSFDEGIEMYQKALTLDPNNDQLKKKLNEAYSKYAGVPAPGSAEAKKKKEDEEKKKKAEADKKKKEDDEKKKKDEEDKKKKEDEEKKKKESAAKAAAPPPKEAPGDKPAEKEEEEEEFIEEEISDDFVTVTTAEIFMKQGLYSEAEKILRKIMKQDPANIEAKMKLDEIVKLKAETEQKGVNVKDNDAPKKGKQSKVSYI